MKRNHLLAVLFVFMGLPLFAQRISNLPKAHLNHPLKAVPAVKTAYTGMETTNNQAESVPPSVNNFSTFQVVGNTVYDLQSNGGVGHRLYNGGNGNLTGVFTLSLDANGYADRGTGYNTATAGTWNTPPTARIESARTGFTNLCVGADGAEYVVAHVGSNKIHLAKRAAGGGAWTESDIPAPTGELWPRAAVGGSNGKTLHMIAVTLPTGNGGTLYQGMNGVVLYHRSTDGGANWDVQGILLPGVDSTNTVGNDVEGYAIDANGDNVSIVVTNGWGDSFVYTSDDNGDTWTTRVLNDFPLDHYVINSGYDTLSLPADPGRPANDPYAIFSTDGTVDILVDDNGVTHVWYGATYVSDSDLTDTGWTFYPGTNIGIVYWNSLMADNGGVVSGYCPDIDGNGVLDITDISNYGVGLSSWPTGSIDAAGNLYVVYSTVDERYLDANSNYNYRQPWIVASTDYGATWNLPKPVLNPVLLDADSTEIPFTEAIYNSAAKWTDDKVHVIFQADYTPLTYLNNSDVDIEPGDNTIRYIGYPTDWALVNTKNVAPEAVKFSVTPNPANDRIVFDFTSTRTQNASVALYDIQGKLVRSTTPISVGVGQSAINMNTADLSEGLYMARVNLGNTFATQKVVIKH